MQQFGKFGMYQAAQWLCIRRLLTTGLYHRHRANHKARNHIPQTAQRVHARRLHLSRVAFHRIGKTHFQALQGMWHMLGNAGGQVCVHLVEYHRRLCEQTGDGEAARFVHQPIAKHIARPHQYRQQR